MRKIKFNNYEEMACAIADKLAEITDEDKFNDISVIAKYEEARNIIRELLCMGYEIGNIDIHACECDGYDDEFIITVSNSDNDNIWCEPMKRDNGYLTDESCVTYILDNCSSKVVSHCKGDVIYEVAIGEDDGCEDRELKSQNNDSSNTEMTHISKDKNGKPTGFTKSWFTEENGVQCYSSYSHYSSDVDMLRRVAEDFCIKL